MNDSEITSAIIARLERRVDDLTREVNQMRTEQRDRHNDVLRALATRETRMSALLRRGPTV